jgi:hypothetical protein
MFNGRKNDITQKISKYFWTIPILTIVVYSATVLFQLGYNSYFNIPSMAIDSSIAYNIIFSFYLLKLILSLTLSVWWFWLLMGIIVVAVFFIFNAKHWLKIIPIIAIIVFLCFCPKIGDYLAKHLNYFYVVSDNCLAIDPDKYVILNFYDDKAVFISIEENAGEAGTKRMTGRFTIKNVPEIGCDIEFKKVGFIRK